MQRPAAVRPLPPADDQAASFVRRRDAFRNIVAEDYVEPIADMLREEGEARGADLTRRMGVSQATAAATITRLQRDGLVETKPSRGRCLTPAGRTIVTAATAHHELLGRFLIAVGLDAETAEQDSEGLEHHVSETALAAFARFLPRQGKGAT